MLATRVEQSILVVEARLNVNLVSLTIEEVVAKRYKMVRQLCNEVADEVVLDMMKPIESWRALHQGLGERYQELVKSVKEAMSERLTKEITEGVDPSSFNRNTCFIEAVQTMLKITSAFDKPENLQQVHLGKAEDDDVCCLTKSCRNLRYVRFDCEKLTDMAAEYLARNCPNLLGVAFIGLASSDAQPENSCNGRDYYVFKPATRVTGRSLMHLAQTCVRLQEVEFPDCTRVGSAGLRDLAANCKDLRVLDLSCTPQSLLEYYARIFVTADDESDEEYRYEGRSFEDDAVMCLAAGCPKLEQVNFAGCGGLAEHVRNYLAQKCPGITIRD